MQKHFPILVTTVNVLTGLLITISLLAGTKSTQAQNPTMFLGPIYYGFPTVVTIFDHNLPVLSMGIGDNNTCTQHNNGTACNNLPPLGLGYDGHDGIDYDLNYKPVLAAADGIVAEAGWSNSGNHQQGLGMYIRIDHSNGYTTEYGHLNVIIALIGQVIAAPANRENIIGISGNTGNSDGAHLHFGLINPDGIYVNPYGWQGGLDDPWEIHQQGAPSYDVWEQYPAIQLLYTLDELQYPTGPTVYEPPVNEYLIEVDDSNSEFFVPEDCWEYRSDGEGINGGYYETDANPNSSPDCNAKWMFDPEFGASADDYDVYIHVPDYAASFRTVYLIKHNGVYDTVFVSQASYPDVDSGEGAWAYLGRYYFDLHGDITQEYIQIHSSSIIDPASEGTIVVADAVRLHPASAVLMPPPVPTGLTAVYHDGLPHLHTLSRSASSIVRRPVTPVPYNPVNYVYLRWQSNSPPSGTKFTVYRSNTRPVPTDYAHRIAGGLRSSSYRDYSGQLGDWYTVTAVSPGGTSNHSNYAEARLPCPDC